MYADIRRRFRDISGNLTIAAADGDTTLVTGKAGHTIFIQRIIVYITTDAAQSAAFEDSNSSPKKIAEVTSSPGDETRWDFDFGEFGVPLTEAKNFVLNVSAVGLAANIVWEGYMKQTSTMSAADFAAV